MSNTFKLVPHGNFKNGLPAALARRSYNEVQLRQQYNVPAWVRFDIHYVLDGGVPTAGLGDLVSKCKMFRRQGVSLRLRVDEDALGGNLGD